MKRLLLVDDDEGNRDTLSALLEDEGFTVDVALSFADAARVLQGASERYDAVLLDHSLGDGYGCDLVPLVRRHLPKARVVAMSASSVADRLRQTADIELPKGMHFPAFLARLSALLG